LVQKNTHDVKQQNEPGKSPSREWIRPLWFLSTVGWYVALSIVIPTGIGYWLDRPSQFDTHPLFTLIGFGLGTIIAFYGLYQMLRRFQREEMEKNSKTKGVK
jgi:F0F1-type ATP synthase assembly protein I